MSTELIKITGVHEVVVSEAKRECRYDPSDIACVSFAGGTARGRCLSINIHQDDGTFAHVQLTQDQARELIATLRDEFE